MGGSAAARDALRARIRALEGSTPVRRRVPCGVGSLDGLIGGLPQPGIVEISGPEGAWRARIAPGAAASFARAGVPGGEASLPLWPSRACPWG